MSTILLLLLALLPGFLLMYYILFMDRSEKEPLGLVLVTLLLGAVSCAPAALVEVLLGSLPIYDGGKIWYGFTTAFIQVAWVEELAKLSVVMLVAWRSKNFDEENDGIVYVGAAALGFAMLENVFYVMGHGVSTGILRALTAMPLHAFTGVLMGYYVGLAKFTDTPKKRRALIFKGFLWAYLLHGVYDALIMTETPLLLLDIPLVIALVIVGVKFLKKGRDLSLARRGPVETLEPAVETAAQQVLLTRTYPKNQVWKIIISRILFVISGLFWLVVIGIIFSPPEAPYVSPADMMLGGIIMSFLPILTAVILELSYRRKKEVFKKLEKTFPGDALPAEVLRTSPPGQLWKAIISRSLLTISGLFWALILLASATDSEKYTEEWFAGLLGAVVISFPFILIGVLMERSYRKRKKQFQLTREEIPSEPAPTPVPPRPPQITDDELHYYAQSLKAKRGLED